MIRPATLSLIWAMDENRLIGTENRLPWKLPADMQWFRKQTMGKPVLMGRKTYESIGKPLPGRENLIMTRQQGLAIEGCRIVHSLDEARAALPDADEIMVIGGSDIYTLLLPDAARLYCTVVHDRFEGDAWFPEYDQEQWQQSLCEHHEADEHNRHAYSFMIYERVSSK
ncbi:MAG: type 3 dihydrofolate reductase [Mariprofundaceae bacterium]|nr:type 3 dihydrofolate reductase [Mariprofundaceae bacterium]